MEGVAPSGTPGKTKRYPKHPQEEVWPNSPRWGSEEWSLMDKDKDSARQCNGCFAGFLLWDAGMLGCLQCEEYIRKRAGQESTIAQANAFSINHY